MLRLDIDAFPDTTPVQVQINTVAPALGPEEVEQQITFPVEQVLSGLPRLEALRSISKFGLSQVVVTFEDGTDIYFARQLVNERLDRGATAGRHRAPEDGAGPTGLGEVFHYVVTGKGDDAHGAAHDPRLGHQAEAAHRPRDGRDQLLGRLREAVPGPHRPGPAHQARPDLRRGGRGGRKEQPQRRRRQHPPERARCSWSTASGGRRHVDQIGNIVVTAQDGVPVRVRDVADVEIGHEIRRGAVTADGKGEVVLGLGFMLMGENSHEVTWSLKHKLDEIKADAAAATCRSRRSTTARNWSITSSTPCATTCSRAGLLVVAVLFVFLGNLRAAAIVALAIPLSMLFAFSGMLRFGIAASLLEPGGHRLRHGRR